MISVRRPTPAFVEDYRRRREGVEPTASPGAEAPDGFRQDRYRGPIGTGPEAFERARCGLEAWGAHLGAGVEVFPPDVPPRPGSTVALVTRQAGLWVLAACRVESVVDEPQAFGFVYATLPDHPERGYESFEVRMDRDDVVFEIEAVSRPGVALVSLVAPMARVLQARAANAYLRALREWVAASP